MRRWRFPLLAVLSLLAASVMVRCSSSGSKSAPGSVEPAAPTKAFSRSSSKVQGLNLNDPVQPTTNDDAIGLTAAKNEWASFALQLTEPPKPAKKGVSYSVRIVPPKREGGNDAIDLDSFSAAQILMMPVDVNRAGFVRQTGLSASSRMLPRALLPIAMDKAGSIDIASLRDPQDATNPRSHPGSKSNDPVMFWIDLHVPTETPAGNYSGVCELIASDDPGNPLAAVPFKVTVHDFVLPDERHLIFSSQLGWEDLKRLYPERFETVTPRLINRGDPSYAGTIKALDSLIKLAQLNRTETTVPRLQPTAKWPAGKPPQVDWSDLDNVLEPWLSGNGFPDKIPVGYWPLPSVDYLDRYNRKSQLEYWTAAATHFDEKDWLVHSPIALNPPVPGRPGTAEALQLCADAAQILSAHSRVRVALPLDEDQLKLANKESPNFIDPNAVPRLLATAPGAVFSTPIQKWNLRLHPQHWLRTDIPGLVPYVGTGCDERDVRVWSYLAFLRQATLIQWGSPLPRTSVPYEPADPNDLIWFYPGSWFGVEEVVPSIQLKWLRRAQQDYEYLWLARQRGEAINATLMARLITKPVEIQPGQTPDPIYELMTGTADPAVWTDAQNLLAKIVMLHQPGEKADKAKGDALDLEIGRFLAPQDQVLLMARNTDWGLAPERNSNWINLQLGIDVYNASDAHPDPNRLQWDDTTGPPKGWDVTPQPMTVPAVATYHVDRFLVNARFDVNAIDAKDRRPVGMRFANGFNNVESKLQFVLPVAPTDRLGPGLNISDGRLNDWENADIIQSGPMVRMFNRPALQRQELQYGQQPATVYTGWADENFYVAFKLTGIGDSGMSSSRNFVDYQFRRAWGEDLCEILIQPIFDDNTTGPVLHVVAKPAEHWIERKKAARGWGNTWQPFEGTIRYARTIGLGEWDGEIAIPWKAITDRDDKTIPRMLRFNFVQHVHATGESSSWAGPIDFGRDDSFMGLLYVRDQNAPNFAGGR